MQLLQESTGQMLSTSADVEKKWYSQSGRVTPELVVLKIAFVQII